ncbi:hypothetical protein Ancab_025407 [Ancistrocladus abbreviatus]
MARSSQFTGIALVKRLTMVTEGIAEERTQRGKSIRHFSHPHALREYKFQQRRFHHTVCNACELDLFGVAYGCTTCNFYLHKSCFEAPRELEHRAHPKHTLSLLSKSTYSGGKFLCSGCWKMGGGFTYHCATCQYDLHVDCAYLPKVMKQDYHKHTLTLYYSTAYFAPAVDDQIYCDVCGDSFNKAGWVYACSKCNYWCHTGCICGEALISSLEEEDSAEDEEDDEKSGVIDTTPRMFSIPTAAPAKAIVAVPAPTDCAPRLGCGMGRLRLK